MLFNVIKGFAANALTPRRCSFSSNALQRGSRRSQIRTTPALVSLLCAAGLASPVQAEYVGVDYGALSEMLVQITGISDTNGNPYAGVPPGLAVTDTGTIAITYQETDAVAGIPGMETVAEAETTASGLVEETLTLYSSATGLGRAYGPGWANAYSQGLGGSLLRFDNFGTEDLYIDFSTSYYMEVSAGSNTETGSSFATAFVMLGASEDFGIVDPDHPDFEQQFLAALHPDNFLYQDIFDIHADSPTGSGFINNSFNTQLMIGAGSSLEFFLLAGIEGDASKVAASLPGGLIETTDVPLPPAFLLFGNALLILVARRWKLNRKRAA